MQNVLDREEIVKDAGEFYGHVYENPFDRGHEVYVHVVKKAMQRMSATYTSATYTEKNVSPKLERFRRNMEAFKKRREKMTLHLEMEYLKRLSDKLLRDCATSNNYNNDLWIALSQLPGGLEKARERNISKPRTDEEHYKKLKEIHLKAMKELHA